MSSEHHSKLPELEIIVFLCHVMEHVFDMSF